MKRKLQFLTKTLLVVAGLCVGANAWGETYLNTVTGTLQSGSFQENRNKVITIAKGENLTYTFVNTSVGNAVYKNWVFEARDATTNYCCGLRGDAHPGGEHSGVNCGAGYWTWDNSSSTLSGNYTGSKWSDLDGTAASWISKYSGVTVTLSINYSNDGTTLTMTHSATVNNSAYTGTYTVTGFVGNNINVFLSNEDATQTITNVVYTNASGDVTHYDLKNVDLSKFDANSTYLEGVASFTLSGSKWSKLDLSSYYSGISGTITNINMKFTENIDTGGRMCFGIFGSNKSSWSNGMPETANSVSTWGVCGSSSNNPNRVYYGTSPSYVYTLTVGSAVAIEVDMDMMNKKFTFIQAGSNLVTNQSFIDAGITSPQYFAGHTWTDEKNATTLTDMTMEIVYLETTYYTATFTNTTSGNTVSATIYTDPGRSSEISNGMLEDGETYYYTATETGYQNYNGSFTVSGSDPAVNFAMTAKTAVSTITVKYKLGDDEITSEAGNATGLYVGENHTVPFRLYVQNAGKLYKTTANGSDPYYGENVTLTENTVVEKSLTEVDLHGGTIELFEDLDDATSDYAGVRASYCSAYGNKAYTSPDNLEEGLYTFIFRGMNRGRGSSVKVGETTILNASDIGASNVWADKTLTNVNIPADGKLTFVAGGSSTIDYFDIIIAVKQPGALATLSTTGYTTFASSRPLNLSGITSSTGTTKAYYVTASDVKSSSVALTEATGNVAAGTGLILNGTAGATVTIPVVASGTDLTSTNMLKGCTVATDITSSTANYGNFYVLGASVAEFQKIQNWVDAPHTLTIPAGKAYLDTTGAGVVGAPTLTFDFGETTGINTVHGSEFTVNGEYYDLQGRRVAQPTKGLYIVNGRKVVIK